MPLSKRLDPAVYRGINRAMTPAFGRWAQKTYGMGGKKLLAKVASAEGGGTARRPNVSYAGARGPFQFIPSTRDAYIKQYGVDAWKTNTSAAKAAMIHLRGTGVAGYNPGLSSYTDLVLGQDVDTSPLRTGKKGGRVRRGRKAVSSKTSRRVSKTTRMVNPGAADALAAANAEYLTSGKDRPGLSGLLELARAKSAIKDAAVPVTDTKVTKTKTRGRPGKTAKRGGKRGTAVPTSPIGSYKRAGRLVEKEVLPIAQRLGIDVTPASVKASNASHGPTVSGGRSDHQGPFNEVWAADMSNGQQPTKQMDLLAKRIAKKFGIPWSGSGAVSHVSGGYRHQLIYKSNVGGNHYNHVHYGVSKV